MASSRSLGSLTLDLIAKIGGFQEGMDKAARLLDDRLRKMQKAAHEFGDNVKDILADAAAAFGIGFSIDRFIESLRHAIDVTDQMGKSAQKVGLSTEAFSGLAYAASLAEVDVATLEQSLGQLTKTAATSLDKTSEQAKIFKALGISVTDATGKLRSSKDVLKDFADRFNDLGGGQEALAAASVLFGRSYQQIIPLLKLGSDGIAAAEVEASKLNQTIGDDSSKSADEFLTNLTRLRKAVDGIFNAVAVRLLPTLESWSDDMIDLAKDGNKLNDTAETIADTLQALAAIAHAVAGGFKFIIAAVKSVTVVVAGSAETIGAYQDLLSHPYDPAAYKRAFAQYKQANQATTDSLKEIWSHATDGMAESIDAAKKNIARIKGEIVDFPKRSAGRSAGSFIDSILGTDQERERKTKLMHDQLAEVFKQQDRDSKAAQQRAEQLADAYAKLTEAVQKVSEAANPQDQAYNKYADTIRNIDQLAADAIKKGADVAQVQAQVAQAVSAAQKKLADDLAKPMRAAQAFSDALDEELSARKEEISARVQSIGLGTQEAENLQELARVYQETAKALADFQKQHELHPEAMTENQYQAELKALKQHNADMIQATKDGQAEIAAAQADGWNGVSKAIADFQADAANNAKNFEQLTHDTLDTAVNDFTDFVTGAKSAGDAVKDFVNTFETELTRLIARKLLAQLLSNVSGGATSGNGSGDWMSMIASFFGGQRATGGPAMPGKMYEVNERGAPELLSVGGRDFLLMGKQAGQVSPLASGSDHGQNINVVNQYTFAAPVSLTTQAQVAQRQAYELSRVRRFR